MLLLISTAACAQQTPVAEQVIPGAAHPPGADLNPGEIERFAELLVGFLILSALVSLVTQRLKIPYTIGLVLVGLAVSFFGHSLVGPINPEVILVLLLPPLIFEAVVRVNMRELRRALLPGVILAVPGVVITTLLVGAVLALGAHLPLPYALVFGALISPTDPVAVMALFRSIGAPRRLQAVFEGESLLNDGTAIVLFKLMLVMAATGAVNVPNAFLQFFIVAGGGVVVGMAVGALLALVINRLENYIVETTLTVVLAYGAYLLGEFFFGVSGVLAVVAAGLTVSIMSAPRLSPTSRIFISNFWEYVAFIANSFIFLMIGVQTKIELLWQNAAWIVWSILAVLIARMMTVWVLRLVRRGHAPLSWDAVLFWGGLRGAVSLALALSLSYGLEYRDQLQAMAFGVVLFSLLVQGSTISTVISRLGLVNQSPPRQRYEQHHARLTALRAAAGRLEDMYNRGLVAGYVVDQLGPVVQARIDQMAEEETQSLETEPSVRQQALTDAWHEALRAQRSAVTGLYRDNVISEAVYDQMVAEIDALIDDEENNWPEIQAVLKPEDENGNQPG